MEEFNGFAGRNSSVLSGRFRLDVRQEQRTFRHDAIFYGRNRAGCQLAAERLKVRARIDKILEKQQAALDARDNELFNLLDAEHLRLCEKLRNLR